MLCTTLAAAATAAAADVSEELFSRADANGDGVLSSTELTKAVLSDHAHSMPPRFGYMEPRELFAQLDSDGSRGVDAAEFAAPFAALSVQPTQLGDVVAVGDVHGCLPCLRRTLQANRIVDADGSWIAGNRTVVQLGDLVHRGPDDQGVINYVRHLEREATAAGGEWVQLIGNHEQLELDGRGDPEAMDGPGVGFGSARARKQAFGLNGDVGSWLRGKQIVHRWEDTVFVHGGISSTSLAKLGVDGINALAFREGHVMDHALWDRFLATGTQELACKRLQEVLELLGAERMIVGHTITAHAGFEPGEVGQRCDGRLTLVDVGMSSAFPHIPKLLKAAHFFSNA
jgi:hypothetical protein